MVYLFEAPQEFMFKNGRKINLSSVCRKSEWTPTVGKLKLAKLYEILEAFVVGKDDPKGGDEPA